MGVVYEAFDRETQSLVALKTLREMSGQALYRFKNEFRALAEIRHPNLVELGGLHSEDDRWFFTMELLDGESFVRHVRGTGDRDLETRPLPASHETADVPPDATRELPDSDAPTCASTHLADQPVGRSPGVPSLPFDLARLRDGLRPLAEGLHALHSAGKVHRDVKPSNVLVTRRGRVVVLDFGLVTDAEPDLDLSATEIVGTAAYMSPEQAAGDHCGPPTDWYAFGILLYEALTGTVPFQGPSLAVMSQKQRESPRCPSEVVQGVPPDLAELYRAITTVEPAERLAGTEILERLQAGAGQGTTVARRRPTDRSSVGESGRFVGREAELEDLAAGIEQVRAGAPAVVLVVGESGVGKSTLVERFTGGLTAREPDIRIFSGRCYEWESVPYKAFDAVVDQLSRWMRQRTRLDVEGILPVHARLLARTFPVLERVEAIAAAPDTCASVVDRQELRSRVFGGLRELFYRFGVRHRVILTLDDLQWADADSLALLEELTRPPEAPPILILGSLRPEGAHDRVVEVLERAEPTIVRVDALSHEESIELARRLAETVPDGIDGDVWIEQLARESGGHPLFLDVLARHSSWSGRFEPAGRTGALRLEDAIAREAGELEEGSRLLLELVALAGGPVVIEVLLDASGLEAADLRIHLKGLRIERLVRATGFGLADTVEPYHDRIREAIARRLDPELRRAHHRSLAVAHEASRYAVEPELLARHWLGAEEPAKAARPLVAAARTAVDQLAFDRAAELYRTALEKARPPEREIRGLIRGLADALANAGRGREAADAYLRGARWASSSDALELTRLASDQYLRSGHVRLGLEALGRVLQGLGLRMPRTQRRALLALAAERARLRLVGLRWARREERDVSPLDLARLDTLYSGTGFLGMIDAIRGGVFQSHFIRTALRCGEPSRVARALALEVIIRSGSGKGSHPTTERLAHEVRGIAEEVGDPYLTGLSRLADGMRMFFDWRLVEGERASLEAARIFSDECVGVEFEKTMASYLALGAGIWMGRMGEIARRTDELIEDASRRGDLYALNWFRTVAAWVYLREDDPDGAERQLRSAREGWPARRGAGALLAHWHEVANQAAIQIYRGEAAAGAETVRQAWPPLRRLMLHRAPVCRELNLLLFGMGAAAERDAKGLRRIVRRLGARPLPYLEGTRALFRATLHHWEGSEERTLRELERAEEGYETAGATGWARFPRYRRGQLLGGDEGARLVASTRAAVEEDGFRNPERWIDAWTPGFTS